MAEKSKINWTTSVWNPISGCSKCSPGCENCSAIRDVHRMAGNPNAKLKERFAGLTKSAHQWTGVVRCHPEKLMLPHKWKKPRRIFVQYNGDPFHPDVPFGFVTRMLWTMAHTPHHTYQLLTKRVDRAAEFFRMWADLTGENGAEFHAARGPEEVRKHHKSGRGELFAQMLEAMGEPPDGCAYPTFDWMEGMLYWPAKLGNVWIGASVEDQKRADERRPAMQEIAALGWNTWVSYEPALGSVDWRPWVFDRRAAIRAAMRGPMALNEDQADSVIAYPIKWLVAGGESGSGARPAHPQWFRDARDMCAAAGVPFFFKQWGEFIPQPDAHVQGKIGPVSSPWGLCQPGMARVGKKLAGRLLDGREHNEFPSASAR